MSRREDYDSRDVEKRESLVQLRDRYDEAQKLVPSDKPYANLEWILGGRRNVTQDPLAWESRTVELVALWLQDLAVEMDRRLSSPTADGGDGTALSRDHARKLAAQSLRDATERFLLAFGHSSRTSPGTKATDPETTGKPQG